MNKQDVIDLALSQVGYTEGKNNYNIYAKKLDQEPYFCTKKQNLPWCAVFVCWLFVMILGSGAKARKVLFQPTPKNNLAAVCTYFANYFKKVHRWFKTPEVGDIVFFKSGTKPIGHVGIVIQVLSTTVVTVEGNKGNKVARVVRKKSECVGFGRPDWSLYPDKKPDQGGKIDVKVRELKRGDKGEDVKTIQRLLKALGYKGNGAVLAIDGKFGPATEDAVTQYQKAKFKTATKIVDAKTWDEIING